MGSNGVRFSRFLYKISNVSLGKAHFVSTNTAKAVVIPFCRSISSVNGNKLLAHACRQDKVQLLLLQSSRTFTSTSLSKEDISEKVMHVCKTFDKIPADKLTLEAHFMNDLGLDSLDHVELIMNIEDDFNFEIPDADAEKLLRPKDIVEYISQKESST